MKKLLLMLIVVGVLVVTGGCSSMNTLGAWYKPNTSLETCMADHKECYKYTIENVNVGDQLQNGIAWGLWLGHGAEVRIFSQQMTSREYKFVDMYILPTDTKFLRISEQNKLPDWFNLCAGE